MKADHRTIHVYKERSPPIQAIAILADRILEQSQHQHDVRLLSSARYRGKRQLGTLFTKERLQRTTSPDLITALVKYFKNNNHLIIKQSSVGGPLQEMLKSRNSLL